MNILCFGESLIRLATTQHKRLEDAQALTLSYGGAEAVVAATLAQQGESVSFATKISTNQLGTNALASLSRFGVDTSKAIRSEHRMGLYYSESGRSIRPTIVTYDRSDTAMAHAKINDFDWDHILNGIGVFFFSGVVPAISRDMEETCYKALIECKGRGIKTVMDLNYRETLWTRERAMKCINRFMPYIDEIIASEDDIISLEQETLDEGDVFDFSLEWLDNIYKAYGLKSAAFVCRQVNRYDIAMIKGAYITNNDIYTSRAQHVTLSDISSCGSVYSASIIHGELKNWSPEFIVDYASMASAFKATVEGDFSFASENEIIALLKQGVKPHIRQ